ncbi:MAG TPA: HAD family hydrolase [Arcobacter sp.]|nr:HAD family hydrolase [Arcobacter sp.]
MIKNIIFDFDGVILDSIPVKTEGFKILFNKYGKDASDELVEFHLKNGGKSRYLKIRYFFEKILEKKITEKEILSFAKKYSEITKVELAKDNYIIEDTFEFIKKNYNNYNMHIASGADEKDLHYICNELCFNKYFHSIYGSPTEKKDIVKHIMNTFNIEERETILIGDSINDYEAAKSNNITFFGYNNDSFKGLYNYIDTFKEIDFAQKNI